MFSTGPATRSLREAAAAEEDEERATLLQSVADYIESTFDYADASSRLFTLQALYAEIAHAYLAGFEHATGERVRVDAALRKAGLGL